MPSQNRQWFPGAIYHIICRGVRRTPIFLHPKDIAKFQSFIDDAAIGTPFDIYAYCFMTNHYHMLTGTKDQPISKIMHAINTPYAQWFNRKYETTGHLFERRYTSVPVPSEYRFMVISAYIHNNPRSLKHIETPASYPFSSYPHYLNISLPHNDFVSETKTPFSSSISTEHLFHFSPNMNEWKSLATHELLSRSPPMPFTKEKLESLFPAPFVPHYERYVEREWKLQQLLKEQANEQRIPHEND
ncbi:transposase [Bacillus shivajii]|uniref:transposase n=1 Tax=Bacillus shivajii TaxID=1983719 RepID=UPI001CFBA696|nr:transposase [Bacillus shivajii]UCZ52666.1 transposase [Bacillus shivajii]